MQNPYHVLLDDAIQSKAQLYENLVQIDTYQVHELDGLQGKLQEKWAKQWHAVIWAPYDWGRELMDLGEPDEKGRANELSDANEKGRANKLSGANEKGRANELSGANEKATASNPKHFAEKGDAEQIRVTQQRSSTLFDNYLRIYWFNHKTELDSEAAIQAYLAQHAAHNTPAGLAHINLMQDKQSYVRCIEQIRADIAAGEMYQINYTTEFRFQAYGSPFKLYQKIRDKQRVPYGVLAHLPDAFALSDELSDRGTMANTLGDGTGELFKLKKNIHKTNNPSRTTSHWTLSFSPELFLDIRQDGTIHTEPMKGTVPTADDGGNEERAAALRADPKNRAENVMIVDLLRNDLSKIAVPNGVHVPELFKVSNFGSVLQMTTPIQAMAKPETQVEDILHALFPCGSITGAPKKRSMQLIDQYETRPRGLYTGSIGFLEPCANGLGFYGKLNVVIRTLQMRERLKNEPYERLDKRSVGALVARHFTGSMGVGSGVVYDSDPNLEYEECYWKARFLRHLLLDFNLFETMRVDIVENVGQCRLLEQHIQRLQRSANDLGFKFNEAYVRATILAYFERLELEAFTLQNTGTEQARIEQQPGDYNTDEIPCPQAAPEDNSAAKRTVSEHSYRVKATLQGDGMLNIQSTLLEPLNNSSEIPCKARQKESCDNTLNNVSDDANNTLKNVSDNVNATLDNISKERHENIFSQRNESAHNDAQTSTRCAHQVSTLLLADTPLANQDFLRRYKTNHRQFYDEQMRKAIEQGAFDTLCFNENDILLEGARSSVFIYSQDQWLTPSLDLDILDSVMRAEILQAPAQWLGAHTPSHAALSLKQTASATLTTHPAKQSSRTPLPQTLNNPSTAIPLTVIECHITREQLIAAEKIIVVNALRGIVPAHLA